MRVEKKQAWLLKSKKVERCGGGMCCIVTIIVHNLAMIVCYSFLVYWGEWSKDYNREFLLILTTKCATYNYPKNKVLKNWITWQENYSFLQIFCNSCDYFKTSLVFSTAGRGKMWRALNILVGYTKNAKFWPSYPGHSLALCLKWATLKKDRMSPSRPE